MAELVGAGAGRGTTGASGGGQDETADAPVAGTGGEMDGPEGDTGGAACNAGATRCAGAVVEECTVAGAWVMKETCAAVCTAGACAGCACRAASTAGPTRHPRPATPRANGSPRAMACPNVCSGMGQCTGQCKPGSKRCSGASNLTTQTCDENGAWVNGAVCPNVCSSGSCGGECIARRQTLRRQQHARADLRPHGHVGAGHGLPVHLQRHRRMHGRLHARARSSAWARMPQICDGQNARWQSMTTCTAVCSNGACTGDCFAGSQALHGNRRSDLQHGWEMGRWSETCMFVCQGAGVCGGQCVPGRRQCVGTTPQVCSIEGMWMNSTGNECLKAIGASCGGGSECMSGDCVDGVCCENACGGTCMSCRNSAHGAGEGRCRAVRSGSDPNNECADGTCRTGTCNGSGACGTTPNGQSGPGCSGASRCSGNDLILGSSCQGGSCMGGGHARLRLQGLRQ